MNHNRYALLDGIRGIAALFVVIRHTGEYWHFDVFRSYLAVDVFYILSGFVIAAAYESKMASGSMGFKQFALVRLIRLYPVYLLSVIVSTPRFFAKLIVDHHHHLDFATLMQACLAVVAGLFFIPFHMPGDATLFPVNPVYWTLFFELLVNAIFAATRRMLTEQVLRWVIIVSGVLLAIQVHAHGNLNIGFLFSLRSVAEGLTRATFGIFFGLLLYRHKDIFTPFSFHAARFSYWAIMVMMLILMSPATGSFDWLIDMLSVTLVFPVIVLLAAQNHHSRLLWLMLMLGSASYPIYVLHVPIAGTVAFACRALFGQGVDQFAPLSGIVLASTLVTISIWIEKYYDIPFRKWLSQRILASGKAGK